MQRFRATDGHRKCTVFLFYLSSAYHIYILTLFVLVETISLKIWERPMSWPANIHFRLPFMAQKRCMLKLPKKNWPCHGYCERTQRYF